MSKVKKNSVKTQGGDPFTRWLVIGMVALVLAVGTFFFLTSEKKESNASLVALESFSPIGDVPATVDPAVRHLVLPQLMASYQHPTLLHLQRCDFPEKSWSAHLASQMVR